MPIIVAGQSKAMILFPGLFYSGLCPVSTLFEHWMKFIQSTLYRPWQFHTIWTLDEVHPEYTVQALAQTQFHTIWTLDESSSRVQLYRPLAKLNFTLLEHWMNFIHSTLYRPWPKLNFTLLEGGVKCFHPKSTVLRPWVKLSSTTFEEWMNFIQRTLYRRVYCWWVKKKSIRAWAKFKFHPI